MGIPNGQPSRGWGGGGGGLFKAEKSRHDTEMSVKY